MRKLSDAGRWFPPCCWFPSSNWVGWKRAVRQSGLDRTVIGPIWRLRPMAKTIPSCGPHATLPLEMCSQIEATASFLEPQIVDNWTPALVIFFTAGWIWPVWMLEIFLAKTISRPGTCPRQYTPYLCHKLWWGTSNTEVTLKFPCTWPHDAGYLRMFETSRQHDTGLKMPDDWGRGLSFMSASSAVADMILVNLWDCQKITPVFEVLY